ncbi:glycosyltransferase [Clostridium perfringens]|uniref:glycosyltransferase n=1 Tax=Clostridium perfringens TaxID=1502 RepID=UPI0032DB4B9D
MNILYIGADPKSKGGISTITKNYICFFNDFYDKKNFNVEFIFSYIEGKGIYKIKGFCKEFIKFFKKKKYIDIIHIHMSRGFSLVREGIFVILSKIFGKKCIIHFHSGKFPSEYKNLNLILKLYIKLIFNICDYIICLNEEQKVLLKNISSKKIKIIENSINNNIFNNYNSESKEILFLGKVCKEKGVYDLINAISNINEDQIKVNILGDGELENLKILIKNKKLTEKCNVLGWVNNDVIDKFLKRSCFLVLPSYHEGMPFSILEAMAYGLPIISTSIGSIPKIITENKNGFLINPGDINDLTEKIIILLKDKELRKFMSRNNKKCIDENYSMEKSMEDIFSVYKEVIKDEENS